MNNKKVLLVVMDGVGITEEHVGNAVYNANTPNLDRFMKEYPCKLIKAHGTAVGLSTDEDMGNSEVGHNALGCGQIYSQGAKLVDESIRNGEIYNSRVFNEMVNNVKENNSTFHFIGLLSDGNVHSNIEHLLSILKKVRELDVKKVRCHILLDGRDVPPTSALTYVDELENLLSSLKDDEHDYRIASGGGRMKITMDRYKANWDMVKDGYDIHVLGKGRGFSSAREAIETYRNEIPNVIDQDLPGFVIVENNEPVGKIVDNDSVLLFNFRGDRSIELSMALTEENFEGFDREYFPNVYYAGMLQYDSEAGIPPKFLVEPPKISNTLTEELIKYNINELAVSETQKFGHVTYFWNGNRQDKFDENLETYIEIPSDNISFDKAPAMKAREITDKVIEEMKTNKYQFVRLNFPNGDMVGHTGNYEATVESLEVVDECLGRLETASKELDYVMLLMADHGNSEVMYTEKDGVRTPKTSHTCNPVPFVVLDNSYKLKEGNFGLSNVAASVLKIYGIEKPAMWNDSIIE